VAWLRRGDWHPTRGTWVGALLAIQLIGLGQALLRGADYVRTPGREPHDLNALTPPPLWVWGLAFCGFAVLGLIGIAGHWGYVVAAGHCGVAALYVCIGVALLEAAQVASLLRLSAGALVFCAGAALVWYRPPDRRTFAAARALCVALLIIGALGVIDGIGHGYRTATGQLAAAAIHGTLGLAILRTVQRQRIRARITDSP
jgi:hypothetical protein